jgi:hypothetical protein
MSTRNISAFPPAGDTYQVFIAGSTMAEPPGRAGPTDGQAACRYPGFSQYSLGHLTDSSRTQSGSRDIHERRQPQDSTVQATSITAWVQARFPLNVVWTGPYDKDTRAPKPGGYAIAAKGASVYKWNEISGKGTAATNFYNPGTLVGDTTQRDDGTAGPFQIGFNFPFYGKTFTKFWIGVNGLMSFSDSVMNSAAATTTPWTSAGYYDAAYTFPGPGNPFKNTVAALQRPRSAQRWIRERRGLLLDQRRQRYLYHRVVQDRQLQFDE